MKFNQLCALSTLFLASFLCIAMDGTLADQNWQLFRIKANEKLSFSMPQREILVKFCNHQLAYKYPERFNAHNIVLAAEVSELQKNNLALQSQAQKYSQKINELNQDIKKLTIVNKEKAKQRTNNPKQVTKPVVLNQATAKNILTEEKQISVKEKLNAMRMLMKKYNVKERVLLITKMESLAYDASSTHDKSFDKNNHFLLGTINPQYRFIFCPCTRQLEIVDHGCQVSLPHGFACSDKCSFYQPKNMSSHESDTSSESEKITDTDTESDSSEEDINPVLLSKEDINNMC